MQGLREPKRLLPLIIALGFIARVVISFLLSMPNMHRDSYEYFNQADTILAGGYTNFFPNGFPFIIAVVKTIFGHYTVSVLLWMNIIYSTLTIYFVYDISKRVLKNENAALLAAFIIACFPSQINYVRWLTTEIPTTFFMLGAFFFYFRKKYIWSGLFFGIAVVIRTEILPVFVLLFIAHLFYQRKINIKLAIGALVPMLFVCFYCYNKTGQFSMAGHGKVNTLIATTASGGYIDWNIEAKHPEIKTNGDAVQLYLDTMKKEPGSFFKNRLANLWELWGFYPSSADNSRGTATRLLIGAGNFFLLIFGLIGWWKNRKNKDAFILIFPFVVITALHIAFFAMQRYTIPVEPFLIVLAGWSVYSLIFRVRRDNN